MPLANAEHVESTLGALVVREMRLLYGAKFAQQWQGLSPRELRESWDQKLAGLNETQVRRGLAACHLRDWPPTLPEFLRLCCPWMTPEVAYHEAVRGMSARQRGEIGEWSHPAVYWAAVGVSSVDLLNSTFGSIKARWEKTLAEELSRGTWPDIPEPHQFLPAPGQTVATREEAAAAMRKMGADKALAQKGRDPLRWAHKILAEQSRKGGRRYAPTVLAMAERALAAAAATREPA